MKNPWMANDSIKFCGCFWRAKLAPLATSWLLAAVLALLGCGGTPAQRVIQKTANTTSLSERLTFALDNLFALEQFESGDFVGEVLKRLEEAEKAGSHETLDPLALTWPEPAMLRQIADRLAQWLRDQQPPSDWQPDPLLQSLPTHLKQLPMVRGLESMELVHYDCFALMEAAWLRDCARWVSAEKTDQLGRVQRLFDWTVRNIQLENPATAGGDAVASQSEQSANADTDATSPSQVRPNARIPLVPWEVLLFGRGTAWERAWLFIHLARQVHIPAAVLAIASDSPEHPPRPWAIGVLVDGQVYVFDPQLGLPIPGPDGLQLGPSGTLRIKPATLAQLAADESLLRQMDASTELRYPVSAADLGRVVALVEASPASLSRRIKLIEANLSDKHRMVLAVSAQREADRWRAAPNVSDAALWLHPYQTLYQRTHLTAQQVRARLLMLLPLLALEGVPLYKGRLLHLRGQFTGEETAVPYYLAARPSDQQIQQLIEQTVKQYVESQAAGLATLPPAQRKAEEQRLAQNGLKEAQLRAQFIALGKQDATFWLAVISAEQGNFRSAADYLGYRAADTPLQNRWALASHYLMARLLEAIGQTDAAAELYEAKDSGPYRHGNLLRAGWLRQLSSAAKQSQGETRQ